MYLEVQNRHFFMWYKRIQKNQTGTSESPPPPSRKQTLGETSICDTGLDRVDEEEKAEGWSGKSLQAEQQLTEWTRGPTGRKHQPGSRAQLCAWPDPWLHPNCLTTFSSCAHPHIFTHSPTLTLTRPHRCDRNSGDEKEAVLR